MNTARDLTQILEARQECPSCVGTLVRQQNLGIRSKHSRNYRLLKKDVQETALASHTKTTFPMESSDKPSGPMPICYPR